MASQVKDQLEEQRRTKSFIQWKGCNTAASRNAIPDDTWYQLENMQPIGNANIHTIYNCNNGNAATVLGVAFYWEQYVNFLGTDYRIIFSTDGKAIANVVGVNTSIAVATGLSGAGSRAVQWKNSIVLIIDSTGYYFWNNTGNATLISGTGVPTSGDDIAVAFGRVWISQGRLITFSGANDYTATSFLVANGAGSIALTDPTFRGAKLTRMIAQNGYLYLIGVSSINAISDVYVPSGASPPTPLFTNLNIQATIGSDQPASFVAFNQALLFANQYGIYALYGTQAQRISADIDGTWQYRDPSVQVSAGAVVSNNILCAAFLMKRLNDPIYGSNTILCMYSDNKWWFARYQPTLAFVSGCVYNNAPALAGFTSNISPIQSFAYLYFVDATTSPPSKLQTKLWPMEDQLADKEVIRAGFEITAATINGVFTATIDTVNLSSSALTLNSGSYVSWINNSLAVVSWINNSFATVTWFSSAYLLYNGTAPGMYGKYVGMTITNANANTNFFTGSQYQFNAVDMDYKLRARW